MGNKRTGIIVLLAILIVFVLSVSLIAQESGQTTTRRGGTRVLVDTEVFDDEIVERIPEASIQPRTRTDEINFTLNYLREILLESNKELY
jgi:hypothetical protein